jgi:hypothetical protein
MTDGARLNWPLLAEPKWPTTGPVLQLALKTC